MKKLGMLIIAVAGLCIMGGAVAYAAPAVDVKQFPTGFFVPDEASTYSSPYYRWHDEDWGWTHGAIDTSGATTASLFISAWDVDAASGEVDKIYAWDGATQVLLGSLAGLDNDWGYTTFPLGANFYDDIAAGLQVWMDIDSTHSSDTWAVTLAKSVLSVDGGTPPPPPPGVPEGGSTLLLLGLSVAAIGTLKKRMSK